MEMETEIKCPVCKGDGIIKKSQKKYSDKKLKRECANILREHGYSIREIMKLLGYKSPRAVQYLLTINF